MRKILWFTWMLLTVISLSVCGSTDDYPVIPEQPETPEQHGNGDNGNNGDKDDTQDTPPPGGNRKCSEL